MAKKIKLKDFVLSSWAIDHKAIIYLIMIIFFLSGIIAYIGMPRENFPEIKDNKIYISSLFPGNSSEDMERLITTPLEKEIKNVSNLIEITSTSQEDYSIITAEFDENITNDLAKQKIKDEIDVVISNSNWPTFNGTKIEPNVFALDFSELLPIISINMVGDFTSLKFKEYATILKDRIEEVNEVKNVSIRGLEEFEVEVEVDIYKMKSLKISFNDILNAISNENNTLSAGNVTADGERKNIRILGEAADPLELKNFVIKTDNGIIYLGDIADISFKEKEKTSYARSFQEKVITLDVTKRKGENLIDAVEKITKIVIDTQTNALPKDMKISFSNDQSKESLNQVNDLINNIIFGVILVVTVLTFFLGFRNALFVGFAIPMSMLISFMILNSLGYTLNTMVLFGLVMGLGMLVDNGIVVVENVYRLMEKEGMNRIEAAKKGIGEIAFPIIISTATTVAAFVPLGFWPGIMGEFMIFFPITLSVVLGSSLVVAIFFNSLLVSRYMNISKKELSTKLLWKITLLLGGLGIILIFNKGIYRGVGTLMILIPVLFWAYKLFIKKWAFRFQNVFLSLLENKYKQFLLFALRGKNPFLFLGGTFGLLIFSFILLGISSPKVEFFPENQPNQIIIYVEYPEGTDIEKTNLITKEIEKDVFSVINRPKYNDNDYNFMVKSAIAQVGKGASNPFTDGGSSNELPHKGKITLTMREFKYRKGVLSENLRKSIQKELKNKYPGIVLSVEKDQNGPPVGYPINIEIKGKDYETLIETAENMKNYIEQLNISGIEKLKIDVNKNKSKLNVHINREKAGGLGVSASQVGRQLRVALFGEKAGVYKKDGEDYEINVRFKKEDRTNMSALFNQSITFRDPATGKLKEVPIAAIVSYENQNSFSAIKHKKLKRVVVLYSSVLAGYNSNEVVNKIKENLKNYDTPNGINYSFTGEIEEQAETMGFLSTALLSALALILILLVIQFNSISKPLVILLSIFLSFTGVLYGLIVFQMPFVILMTMLGIISLAGIVVNNGVVLLDYTQLLIDREKEKLNIPIDNLLPREEAMQAFVSGGIARLRPVILTAITTILGLLPLAIGLNINFFSLFTEWDSKLYIGGDNVIFWGPLAWTVIFGLSFATFLTLVILPSTYFIVYRIKLRIQNRKLKRIDPNRKIK